MSKFDKLLARFLLKPKDFSYTELRRLLKKFGYDEFQKGKISGSRVCFVHKESKHILQLHKPHPENILKQYQIEQIIKVLTEQGDIK